MTIYVDPIRTYAHVSPLREPYGNEWCHMAADSLEELHDFAAEIGLRTSWFQRESILPHYDLTPGKRRKAVQFGAREVTGAQMVMLARKMQQRRKVKGQAY